MRNVINNINEYVDFVAINLYTLSQFQKFKLKIVALLFYKKTVKQLKIIKEIKRRSEV